MRTVEVVRHEHDHERRTAALAPPADGVWLDGDVRLVEDGRTVAFQVVPPYVTSAPEQIARGLAGIEWDDSGANSKGESRLSGIAIANRTFGTLAPVPLRRRYGCSTCRFDSEYPRLRSRLAALAEYADQVFADVAPEQHAAHVETVGQLHPDWLLGTAPWTSGVINRSGALPYHRDAGNLKGSWSAMLGLKHGCEGGYLHLPDFGVWLAIPDRSLTFFDGARTLHAVTPFRLSGPKAYRYTIVMYAKSIQKCLGREEEVGRAQRERTASEGRIAGRLA